MTKQKEFVISDKRNLLIRQKMEARVQSPGFFIIFNRVAGPEG